jgi:hypothetical protein
MKATYQHSWLWFLVAIFMVPLAYGQGETTLVANFANGNTDFFRSRVYLWNPSSGDASITVRVFSLTRSGPSELLGTADLGLIEAETARNIRLEDIFVSIGLPAPYEENSGNITLEFTVGADNVRGSAQVFNNSLSLAFGTYPLQVIPASTGTNTPTGTGALQNNTIGIQNTATGFEALFNNTTGNFNTASGFSALFSNTTGSFNTASGVNALGNNTIGINNTASGLNALFNNTTGSFNIASGFGALFNNTTGRNNTAVGNQAGVNATTGHDNIYIGNRGVAAESDTIRIGDGSVHTSVFIAGIRSVGSGSQVVVDNNGRLGELGSSKRFKGDIHDMGEASTNLMRLRPVTFRYKEEFDSVNRHLQYGLIAEEVAEVYPELVVYDDQGRVQTVLYQQLSGMLLNELQKQHRHIQEITERLSHLEQVLTAQQTLAAVTQ